MTLTAAPSGREPATASTSRPESTATRVRGRRLIRWLLEERVDGGSLRRGPFRAGGRTEDEPQLCVVCCVRERGRVLLVVDPKDEVAGRPCVAVDVRGVRRCGSTHYEHVLPEELDARLADGAHCAEADVDVDG